VCYAEYQFSYDNYYEVDILFFECIRKYYFMFINEKKPYQEALCWCLC